MIARRNTPTKNANAAHAATARTTRATSQIALPSQAHPGDNPTAMQRAVSAAARWSPVDRKPQAGPRCRVIRCGCRGSPTPHQAAARHWMPSAWTGRLGDSHSLGADSQSSPSRQVSEGGALGGHHDSPVECPVGDPVGQGCESPVSADVAAHPFPAAVWAQCYSVGGAAAVKVWRGDGEVHAAGHGGGAYVASGPS